MRDELEIMLKSYDYLRQEILNSINWQNRFVIAEATIISALLGFGLTQIEDLLVAIPPAVIALTAFWVVEQSRMMRAGNFLQLLEDEINIEVDGAYILWENWERLAIAGSIHKFHHWAQFVGVVSIFYAVSGFSIYKIITLSLLPLVVWGLYIALLAFLFVLVFLVILHRSKSRAEFKKWKEDTYWGERLEKNLTP